MERLTKRTPNGIAYMAIADTLPKRDQEIEGSKPILEGLYALFQKLADYEDLEDKLIIEYDSNATVKDLINLHFKHIEILDGEQLKGFRILTNDDAKLYDEWKLSKQK